MKHLLSVFQNLVLLSYTVKNILKEMQDSCDYIYDIWLVWWRNVWISVLQEGLTDKLNALLIVYKKEIIFIVSLNWLFLFQFSPN